MSYNRWEYIKGNLLFVIRFAKTHNKKIAPDKKTPIIQTYTYSREQFNLIANGGTWKELIKYDHANCGDCPFSGNQGHKAGKCYTHKFIQLKSLERMLRSIVKKYDSDFNSIPEMPESAPEQMKKIAKKHFVRFGTYGEPVLMPLQFMKDLAVGSYSGYTHQWMKDEYSGYKDILMASCHNGIEQKIANKMGWRCFIAAKTGLSSLNAVSCPASNEMGFKSNCSACSLCSGVSGKGKKDIKIAYH